MKNRLLVCQSSHSSYTSNECSELDYTDVTECVKVLYPVYWPDNVDVRFGINEISKLCARFGVSTRPAVWSFRSFVESHGKTVEDDLRRLVSSVAVIPVLTAECERGFSTMNLLLTSRSSSLHVTTLSSLLFLKMVGPPLEQFHLLQYVKSWLAKGHHAASDVGCKTHLPDSGTGDLAAIWKNL